MYTPLVSLREAANTFNTGEYSLETAVELHVRDVVTRWVLTLQAQPQIYDTDGRPTYHVGLWRAGIEMSIQGDLPPEALWTWGPLDDIEVVVKRVFGIDPDARIWAKDSRYTSE